MSYHWNWAVFLQPSATGEGRYIDWLLQGLEWTLLLSLSGWVIALAVGSLVGMLRTAPNRLLAAIAACHVEVFRNIPLLVQLFIWYFVLPELLPPARGNEIKQMNPLLQQFLSAALCLGLFTSARVAEQVRAGIDSVPVEQKTSALALGFSLPQAYRHIIMPIAYRIIVPPLTSEFLNIFKNSAVATAIGLVELSRQAQQLLDYTAQPYEAFIAVTLLYMMINATVIILMRRLEEHVRVPGFIGSK